MNHAPDEAAQTPSKWRPKLSLIVFVVLTCVLLLPLFSLYFLKIYQNQLIQKTEAELIAQSAVLTAVLQREIEATFPSDTLFGPKLPAERGEAESDFRPIFPRLDLISNAILPPRPEAVSPTTITDARFVTLGNRIAPDLVATQKTTLAGFRLLDPNGTVIAGRGEVGLSLAHVDEIAAALRGKFSAVLRKRISAGEPPSLRIFTAMPVIVRDQVAAVVYASRTPSNVFEHLYEQREKVILACLTMIFPTLLIGFVFHRTITAPMRELIARTQAIGKGDRSAIRPLRHHGTSEFARLSQSFLDMAERLNKRSDFISIFATHVSHELKSPLTSIKGAAELLRDDVEAPTASMSAADRLKFLDNIIADAGRLAAISSRLRDLARAENPLILGASPLILPIADLRSHFPSLDIQAHGDLDVPMRISAENLLVLLTNLADNAAHHGATRFDLTGRQDDSILIVEAIDNGDGISLDNRTHIFDSFFTTRRDFGGTGMGLAIVRAMLVAHGGSIRLLEFEQGAAFEIKLPIAQRI